MALKPNEFKDLKLRKFCKILSILSNRRELSEVSDRQET